jgi:putative salt-induced outer membrane protein YdiY
MQLYGEFGGSYFNEDFKLQPDKNAFRFRTSVKWDWPIIADKVALYHYDEFFPSAEYFKDFYITTDQGLVFNVFKNFVTKFQLTYRYNNNPPAGVKNADTIYLITFGYSLGK